MKILALECSAGPASAAVIDDGKILADTFVNVKITHSQTLIPIINDMLKNSLINLSEIEGFAVSAGPGSFTGIRIGIAAVKGLAQAKKLPCVGISTLLSMAYNFIGLDCTVCAVMDARCQQVYNAIFDISGDKITPLCSDRAISCEELREEIKNLCRNNDKPIIVCGDGTDIFYGYVSELKNVQKSPEILKYQNAASVGLASYEKFVFGDTVLPDRLLPFYLRLPQAERELKEKLKNS